MPVLADLVVEEVSLVDRPATGRRFRIFKRDAASQFFSRWLGGGKDAEGSVAGSEGPTDPDQTPLIEPENLFKQVEETLGAVQQRLEDLAAQCESLEKRLESTTSSVAEPRTLEKAMGIQRQSLDPRDPGQVSLWKGVF